VRAPRSWRCSSTRTNHPPTIVDGLLAEIAKYGTAYAKRTDGDWTSANLGGRFEGDANLTSSLTCRLIEGREKEPDRRSGFDPFSPTRSHDFLPAVRYFLRRERERDSVATGSWSAVS